MAHIRLDELMQQKSEREGRRITQADVAQAIDVAQGTLSRWVGNKVDCLNTEILAKLCDYFECEPGDLIVIRER